MREFLVGLPLWLSDTACLHGTKGSLVELHGVARLGSLHEQLRLHGGESHLNVSLLRPSVLVFQLRH
uniref:Uncharacterized protein MANES_12G054100 n=1 Tax=Rhizophora mucronata TaxID=61149 RepID=A0A2P2JEH6_RHIMU